MNLDARAGLSVNLGGAQLEAGYKVQQWSNLFPTHYDVRLNGRGTNGWDAKILTHGPVLSLTVPLSR